MKKLETYMENEDIIVVSRQLLPGKRDFKIYVEKFDLYDKDCKHKHTTYSDNLSNGFITMNCEFDTDESHCYQRQKDMKLDSFIKDENCALLIQKQNEEYSATLGYLDYNDFCSLQEGLKVNSSIEEACKNLNSFYEPKPKILKK